MRFMMGFSIGATSRTGRAARGLLVATVMALALVTIAPTAPDAADRVTNELYASDAAGDDVTLLPAAGMETAMRVPDSFISASLAAASVPLAYDRWAADSLNLIAGAEIGRTYSTGTDTWQVFHCAYGGSNAVPIDLAAAVAYLNSYVPDVYDWMSGGVYAPTFVAGSTLPVTTANGCDAAVVGASSGTANGALVITDEVWGGGLGGPGYKSPGVDFGSVFPGNSRSIWMGACTVADCGFGALYPGTIIHELGHALDWPHSFVESYNSYDVPIDIMGSPSLPDQITGTISLNLYAAGWIANSQVVSHAGDIVDYYLGDGGGGSLRLLVIPGGETGLFTAIDARTSKSYDELVEAGVSAFAIDQRIGCPLSNGNWALSCTGTNRQTARFDAGTEDATLQQVGSSFTVGSYTVEVISAHADGYGVRVRLPSATFAGTFLDDDRSTFVSDIEWMAAEGITLGCNAPLNTMFCPEEEVTRAQMASFLVRALDLPAVSGNRFTDVSGPHAANINALAAAGITQGCDSTGTVFCPAELVTREQMASFLARGLGLSASSGNRFTDVTGGPHIGNINAIAQAGITLGCDATGTVFCPKDLVIRGQMAAFLHRGVD